MPNSPSINFKIENLNVQTNIPQVGVSCLLARTTKGPYNDPSTLLTSFTQFKNLFGSEIVPDGSPSNIEKAFVGGSKLRIIRVPGNGYYKGVLGAAQGNDEDFEDAQALDLNNEESLDPGHINDGELSGGAANIDGQPSNSNGQPVGVAPYPMEVLKITSGDKSVSIGFYTKTYDEYIDGSSTFDASFVLKGNTIFCVITGTGKTNIMEDMPVVTFKNHTNVDNTTVDYLSLYQFLTTSSYLEPQVLSNAGLTDVSLTGIIKWLQTEVDGSKNDITIKVNNQAVTSTPIVVTSTPGYSGTAPTKNQWLESLDYLRDHTEPYQVACSNIEQHLSEIDALAVHHAAKELVDELDEFTYYIEVPKNKVTSNGKEPMTKSDIITWATRCQNTIGHSRNVAYFAGGIKYNDENGILVDGNVLGTIIGLGDDSASKHGPWKSFAGMNRGVIWDGNGPVSPNYGVPSRYNDLNDLANNYINIIVVKDTSSSGKQTMLWHCFTSQVKQDSFKFLSIVRLIHYLKKMIRPILENKIEEPNYIPTWKDIYYEVKPILDNLLDEEAISEYNWAGDQNATGYNDMQINNEADVRQGKYKAILTFKDIVPMQDITIGFVIDKTSKTVSVDINE